MSKPSDDQEAIAILAEHMQKRGPIKVEMDAEIAFAILGCLQLSLRHPGNRGHAAELAEQFARSLQTAIAAGNSDVYSIMERGWLPELDTLGATGEYADGGPTSEDDEGELRTALCLDRANNRLEWRFGKSVAWLSMTREQALAMLPLIREKANQLEPA